MSTRTQMDCNWIVPLTAKLRAEVRAKLLAGVTGLEARLAVKIKVAAMDYRELAAASKTGSAA